MTSKPPHLSRWRRMLVAVVALAIGLLVGGSVVEGRSLQPAPGTERHADAVYLNDESEASSLGSSFVAAESVADQELLDTSDQGRHCSYRDDDGCQSARLGEYRVAPSSSRNATDIGSEFFDDAIRSPVVRPDLGNLSSKIQRQVGTRGWTSAQIDEAVLQGKSFPAVNKLGGAKTPATRCVHPQTGQSVVIDNATGQVIQVGGPGFRYG